MYKGAGNGGTTVGSSAGSVGAGSAQEPQLKRNEGLGLQLAQGAANIELTKAQAELARVEAAKKAGVDTAEANARIGNMKQLTQNAEVQNEIMNFEKGIKEIQLNITKETEENLIKQSKALLNKMLGEAETARNTGKLTTENYKEMVKQAKLQNINTEIEIALKKSDIQINNEL